MAKRNAAILAFLLLTLNSGEKHSGSTLVSTRDTIRIVDTIVTYDTVWLEEVVELIKPMAPTTEFVPVQKFDFWRTFALHIKTHEGYRDNTYNCIAGYETIGWGHLWKEGEPKQIDKKTADLYFQEDFQKKFDKVSYYLPYDLLKHERYAFAALMFQCRMTNFKKSSLAKYLKKHFEEGTLVGVDGKWIRVSPYEDKVRKAWKKWSRYKDPKSGKYKTHPKFIERRNFEVETFLLGENFVASQSEAVEKEYMRKHEKYFK